MTDCAPPLRPKLRPLDIQPLTHNGRSALLLRDPLRLSERSVMIPQELAPLLVLCDGTRDAGALRAALMVRFGLRLSAEVLERLLETMDEALLFEGVRFEHAREDALAQYRAAPFRPPALAGLSYPAAPDELRAALDALLGAASALPLEGGRGLVSPHIDYARGGPVYAQVWKRAAAMARAAELAVVLGTDHSGGIGRITLTRQHYATPYGVLPTATEIVDQLAEALGPEQAFAEELHHRGEHSIELAAVWLHHMRAGRPCRLLPVLCGSFGPFVQGQADPESDPCIAAFLAALRPLLVQGNALVIAAADLAHVGPAFGGRPVELVTRARLQAADEELIAHMCAGDAGAFLASIARAGDGWNVCGLPPIYLALRLLAPVSGEAVAYERCPADAAGMSLVSVCGVVFG
jgi:AmmeMemoRadiSam system protein B